MSEALGIYQGDMIVESALRAGIKDVKANPWLLNRIFRSLLEDEVTKTEYGKRIVDKMISWIIKHELPTFVNTRLEAAHIPCITINLIEEQETKNTTGDVHHDTTEPMDETEQWAPLCSAFNPLKWVSASGELTLPDAVTAETYVFPGMNVMDRFGKLYPITDVKSDDAGHLVATLSEGLVADFTGAVLKSKDRPEIQLESAVFRSTYLIGCHVSGESWQLTALYSLVKFVLLRYREELLERRGYETSSLTATDFSKNQAFESDTAWSRYISLTGECRDVWPKKQITKVQGIDLDVRLSGGDHLPPTMEPDEHIWLGDQDVLTLRTKR